MNRKSLTTTYAISLAVLTLLLLTPHAHTHTHPQPATRSPQLAVTTQRPEKLVMAFHYTWFSPEDFAKGQMSDRPPQPYRSSDPATLERQILEAKSANIDAFITAWTGSGTESDRLFPALLDLAAKHSFRIALHFETPSMSGDLAPHFAVAARYYSHPAYLRVAGRPALFIWSPQTVGNPTAWVALRSRVDPQRAALWSVDITDPN